jgi:Dopey, N-terminal
VVESDWLVELLKDPSFKRYTTLVDRALGFFDTIVEWPDYISFLGRLLKVTNTHSLDGKRPGADF